MAEERTEIARLETLLAEMHARWNVKKIIPGEPWGKELRKMVRNCERRLAAEKAQGQMEGM